MRNVYALLAGMALTGCVTMPDEPTKGVRALGDNLFSISQNAVPFGGTAERAAKFCNMFGQQMHPQGSSTEYTLWSDRQHAVLMFTCEDR